MSVSPPASQRPGPPEAEGRAAGLAPAACPRCSHALDERPEACPKCGFSLENCARTFTFDPPPLQFLMDPEGRVPPGALEALRARRDAFRARFPQIDFSFCLVGLAEGHRVRDFSFWLFNRAPGAADSRAWHLLVTADLKAGCLALTPGYAIEPFLRHDAWNSALQALAGRGAANQWARGIAEFLERAGRLLGAAATAPGPNRQPRPADS